MRYTLENDKLKVEIDSFGAELKSVFSKQKKQEYMWYADKKFWARTSPVLFPFVGSLKNKEFECDGKNYPMGQHGFARDLEHTLVSKTSDTIWFRLESNAETLSKYPFAFTLEIGYELKDNQVKVLWHVTNPDEKTLPFSIGAHPAFLCPIHSEGDGEDKTGSKAGYQLSFGKFEKANSNKKNEFLISGNETIIPLNEIHHHGNTRDTGLAITEDITLPLVNGKVAITDSFFDRCTYMIEGNQANSVGIVDPDGNEYVTVLFDTPLFAIWSPEEKNAPFVCIEPWYGRCDHVDFTGSLTDREFTNFLDANEKFAAEYIMIFQ